MENSEHKSKKEKTEEQASPYQELYGKKQEDAEPKSAEEELLDSAGAFGSAAKKPGPESSEPAADKDPGRNDRDGENGK